ncbi:MAG TPA: hypothetical protein VFQ47_03680 [Nitrososphaera sp.]|nr:hypothetical protein [Nitrososphaera sp.]
MSEPDPQLERDKFNYKKCLIERWDKPSMIGAFLFVASLTTVLLLSFFGFARIPEAVQIFIIGVVMFILIFRYFRELTVGTITGKPLLVPQTIIKVDGKRTSIDSLSNADSISRGERLVLPKGDPRLAKS